MICRSITSLRSLHTTSSRPFYCSRRPLVHDVRSRFTSPSFRLTVEPHLSSKTDVVAALKRQNITLRRRAASEPPDIAAANGFVILATPSYASWLEDEDFIRDFVSALTANPPFALETVILSAVVDGLPSPRKYGVYPDLVTSGFSILGGDAKTLLPDLDSEWPPPDKHPQEAGDHGGSLVFSSHRYAPQMSPDYRSGLRCVLPLANTLFLNGKRWTMLATRWSAGGQMRESMLRCSQEIRLDPTEITDPPLRDIVVPVFPVTPERKVLVSFGNIISRLEIDSMAAPASTELEAAILGLPARQLGFDAITIAVWALVIPRALREHSKPSLMEPPLVVDSPAAAEIVSVSKSLLNHLQLGCKLHRVLGGGGGWGAKQGLLSLDPDTSCSMSSDGADSDVSQLGRLLSQSVEDRPVMFSEVAAPGSAVQFYVSTADATATTSSISSLCWPLPAAVFGVDGVDRIDAPADGGVTMTLGIFGALSSGGIVLQFMSLQGKDLQSKLDVPFARIMV